MGHVLSGAIKAKTQIRKLQGQPGMVATKEARSAKSTVGGEVAAERLTQYLQPQNITIYTIRQQLNRLLAQNRLRKDETGDVEILQKFWKPPETWQYKDLVILSLFTRIS